MLSQWFVIWVLQDKKHDIVVVKEGTVKEDEDAALQKLSNIPVFLPILQSSIGSSANVIDQQMLEKLDTKEVIQRGKSMLKLPNFKGLDKDIAEYILCALVMRRSHYYTIIKSCIQDPSETQAVHWVGHLSKY